ncbi:MULTISPECIES: HAD family hydrolase [Porphyromonas]|uniref:3-deoxy-D-manno-octulosonate 8-phosphate phosphatase KdsC n=1 Tax=Porphyromonas canoris TaxID=36875 RepID=A0ABR4XLP0_9PORP|nr:MULTISPECIES: HAD hydrolase family protein [Porphyromonas]KGL53414.1 3-deoxy-D-manno-octulosonate 8-phosphate phosphatase [Porphyromonas canoris]KGN69580.1 3-deoxy-D-manno-octulosonate 8-phosphate phosphatase [Porphyromonas sp. COT-108 OH1349]KGN92892.1 3-deoxy-D-manno-octulosonate 8-phosphate phosphatase [Porphyromonas canoris]KGN96183.1 3-deoxy-D-manno-octulosonate 8-phosphate phosphatase [Porphyromonas sp. COT-108 OH2963]
MSRILEDLRPFKAVIFDVDGVLSKTTIDMDESGIPKRTVNVRDGYAIKQATDQGLILGIITGGYSPSLPLRYNALGMTHVYMKASNKTEQWEDFLQKTGLQPHEVIYVGDDIPDIPVMSRSGLAVAPADAAPEVKAIAHYISPVEGGMGVARDVLEQLMKAKGLWLTGDAFGW